MERLERLPHETCGDYAIRENAALRAKVEELEGERDRWKALAQVEVSAVDILTHTRSRLSRIEEAARAHMRSHPFSSAADLAAALGEEE